MKKSKIIIFSIALAFLMFANISVTLFDGARDEISFQLNSEQVLANPTDHLHEMPPDDSNGGGGNGVRCACKRGDCVARSFFGSRCAPEGENRCWHYSQNCH